jgi:hypothetical protein
MGKVAMKKTEDKKFKSVRRGYIYCSPWCGNKCTWSEYQIVLATAKRVATELGAGLTPIAAVMAAKAEILRRMMKWAKIGIQVGL